MKKNLPYTLFALCFLLIAVGFAQNDYQAELIDSENNEPVFFATIRFQGTSQGLIADYNGQFRIPKQIVDTLSVLEISSIGYKTIQVNVQTWKNNNINVITMKPQIEQLDAVVINNQNGRQIQLALEKEKKLDASEIVRKAVYAIKDNLSAKPYSYLGYYRDYQLNNAGEYFNLNEGIVEQFDAGIFTNKLTDPKNLSALYSFKANPDFPIDSLMMMQYDDNIKSLQAANVLPYGGMSLCFYMHIIPLESTIRGLFH